MQRHPEECAALFTAMFKNNSPQRIFQFLNEDSTLWNDFQLIASLPPFRFIEAFLRRISGQVHR
jgi:lycopene beta-cyclase